MWQLSVFPPYFSITSNPSQSALDPTLPTAITDTHMAPAGASTALGTSGMLFESPGTLQGGRSSSHTPVLTATQ